MTSGLGVSSIHRINTTTTYVPSPARRRLEICPGVPTYFHDLFPFRGVFIASD